MAADHKLSLESDWWEVPWQVRQVASVRSLKRVLGPAWEQKVEMYNTSGVRVTWDPVEGDPGTRRKQACWPTYLLNDLCWSTTGQAALPFTSY